MYGKDEKDPKEFIEYFKITALHSLKSYIKKLGAGSVDFR
jgi:hypothetical protein